MNDIPLIVLLGGPLALCWLGLWIVALILVVRRRAQFGSAAVLAVTGYALLLSSAAFSMFSQFRSTALELNLPSAPFPNAENGIFFAASIAFSLLSFAGACLVLLALLRKTSSSRAA